MTEEQLEAKRTELRRCLQLLSQDEGVRRTNLLELLRDDLSPLQRCWGVNLNNGLEVAQRTVAANLFAHIKRLTPRRSAQILTVEQRKQQYRHSLAINFNIINDPELLEMKLQERRKWLFSEDRKSFRIAVSTGQRDLSDAIDQIAFDLTGETYRPISGSETDENNQFKIGEDVVAAPASVDTSPLEPSVSGGAWWQRRKWLALPAAILAVVLLGGLTTYFVASDNSAAPQSSAAPPNRGLNVTVVDVSDIGLGFSAAWPSSADLGKAQSYANSINAILDGSGEIYPGVFENALKQGAYSLGGVTVRLQIAATSNQEVAITNIYPVLVKNLPVATGALVLYPGGASGIDTIWYQLDHPNVTPKAGDLTGPPFFTNVYRTITQQSGSRAFVLRFKASARSYQFKIAIAYTLGGGPQRVSNVQASGGGDLLLNATGDLCDLAGLPKSQVNQLRKVGYGHAFELNPYPSDRFNAIVPTDPASYIQQYCP
jgi:hypothetical protein